MAFSSSEALAQDGTFSWSAIGSGNQDANVGLSTSKTYLNAVDAGGWGGIVNGVTFARGNFDSNPSGSNYAVTGAGSTYYRDPINLGGELGKVVLDFVYGGTQTVTLSGLTAGQIYTTTFYNFGWDATTGVRQQVITTTGGASTTFDQNFSGYDNANVLRYSFRATGTSEAITFTPLNSGASFHNSAFTTEQVFNNSFVSGSIWTTSTWSTAGDPNGVGANADFVAQASPTTLNLDASRTVGNLRFAGAQAWTLSGSNTLTLQADVGGRAILTAASGSHTIATPTAWSSDVWVTGTGSLVLSGEVGATSSGITKTGAGTLVLSASNGFTGATDIQQGTVLIANSSALGAGGHDQATMTWIRDGATLAIQGDISSGEHFHVWGSGVGGLGAIRSLSGNNALTNVDNSGGPGYALRSQTTVGVDAGSLSVTGFYESGGSYGLTKVGAGTLVLAGPSTYTGESFINAGTLQVGNGGTSGSLGSGAVVNNATLVFNRSDNTTVSNAISGSGSVVKMGGDVLFNTTNTYSGGLTVLSAIAWVDRASALGSGTITMGGAASAGGQLLVDTAGNTTITNDIVASALATGNSAIGGFNTGNGNFNLWTGAITLGRDLSLRAWNTTTRSTFAGKITGNGGITVTQGRVTLENSANDYLGATTVGAGTILQLTGNEVLPDATALAVNGSLTLASGGGTETFGRLSGNGSLSALVPGSYTLAIAHSGTATFDGTISNNAGTISLVKNGSGTQVLTGANTYTGPTTVNGGRLVVANTTASTTYTNNATLEFSASGADIKLAGGTLSGSGTIVKTGADGLWLGGNGATQAISLSAGALIDVQQGYLRNEYGAGDWSANQGSLNVAAGATVDLWDSPGGIRVNSLTGAGSVTNGIGANSNLTVGVANGSGTFGGVISNGVGTVGLVKQGNGVQVLSGNNTYTGTTTVSAGKLVINGDQSAATGVVTVAAGAALGGTGTVGGATTIAGSHTPGNSPGVQTFASDLTYLGGSSVEWELTADSESNSPVVFDQIVVGGDLTFSGSTALSLAFNGPGSLVDWQDTAFWGINHSWLIYDVTGTTTGFANLLLITENWADASGDLFSQYLPGASFALEQQGNDLYLTFQAVPEPSTIVLVGIGLVGLVLVRRRK